MKLWSHQVGLENTFLDLVSLICYWSAIFLLDRHLLTIISTSSMNPFFFSLKSLLPCSFFCFAWSTEIELLQLLITRDEITWYQASFGCARAFLNSWKHVTEGRLYEVWCMPYFQTFFASETVFSWEVIHLTSYDFAWFCVCSLHLCDVSEVEHIASVLRQLPCLTCFASFWRNHQRSCSTSRKVYLQKFHSFTIAWCYCIKD